LVEIVRVQERRVRGKKNQRKNREERVAGEIERKELHALKVWTKLPRQ